MPSVKIPPELAWELIRPAEAENKLSVAFIVDLLWNDVRRHKQREALHRSAGAWSTADHPELAKGGAAHIEELRSEPDGRFEDAIRRDYGTVCWHQAGRET